MAIRGRKPKPAYLRVIEGNRGRRPIPQGAREPQSKPVRPKWLKGRAARLWDEVLAIAPWLERADAYKLASWCERQADFERPRERRQWTAADRREHRAAGSELGLDLASRSRMGEPRDDAKRGPAAKYLT
jgi:phage terminase small subunit